MRPVTQEDLVNGVHCRGRGFNCPTCPSRGSCAESTAPTGVVAKPPLGLIPMDIWKKMIIRDRLREIKEAIGRYVDAEKEIPNEWFEEYKELLTKLKED